MARSRALILLAVMILATAAFSFAGVVVSVNFGPPVLPVYAQPLCPGPGYIWVPGYWAWSPDFGDYYWVPGTWALAPQVGFLWTPGWWGFSSGLYLWHAGYWGPTVGFYGGINYGFGYTGYGYNGGYWRGRDFYYNRTVNNINITNIRNVYNQPVANNVNLTRVAYNGGQGGVQAQPTRAQLAAERQQHVAATSAQVQHEQAARSDPAQSVSRNQGRPAVVATPRPGALNAAGVTRANLPAVNRPAANPQVNGAARPAQNNQQQARTPENVPRPPQNNQQVRAPQNVPAPQNNQQARAPQNVPRPPQNNQQVRTPENVPRPNNTARQAAPAPRVNEAPRPNTAVNNRPAPQPAPQVHNAPRPETAQHAAPAPRPAPPQQQARQVNQPPRPAPQQHAMSRPAPNMTPRAPQPRQAEPPRQTAVHQPPPQPRGRQEEQRPH